MIELKMSKEFFEDMLKARSMPTICTDGIPVNATFVDIVEQGHCLVARFDDSKSAISHPKIKYVAVP